MAYKGKELLDRLQEPARMRQVLERLRQRENQRGWLLRSDVAEILATTLWCSQREGLMVLEPWLLQEGILELRPGPVMRYYCTAAVKLFQKAP